MASPLDIYRREMQKLEKDQRQLDMRKKQLNEYLTSAQKKCKHKRWQGNSFYSQCLDCGIDDL